jgi:alkanesulfonate monooxygenase SsuD/methylene tetrahydromethanopterin reductase-like flavin-dependent oxidoreductase (luciferase family)
MVVLTLSGCFPIRYLLWPGISGSVIDDSTGTPVPNATVILSRKGESQHPLIATVTDAQGGFSFAERHAVGIYVVPEDIFDFLGTVDIYASGYLKESRDVRSKILGNTMPIALGEIRVKRPP